MAHGPLDFATGKVTHARHEHGASSTDSRRKHHRDGNTYQVVEGARPLIEALEHDAEFARNRS